MPTLQHCSQKGDSADELLSLISGSGKVFSLAHEAVLIDKIRLVLRIVEFERG